MSDSNFIGFDLDAAERDLDAVIAYLRDLNSTLIEPAARRALPKLGKEMAEMIHVTGPRSAKHRGPGKDGKQAWRHEFVHAVDTIKASNVKRNKETGQLEVMVGPGRGDNSPSFYLKFHEYGRYGEAGRPFLRPARRQIMDTRAVPVVLDAVNAVIKSLGKGGSG